MLHNFLKLLQKTLKNILSNFYDLSSREWLLSNKYFKSIISRAFSFVASKITGGAQFALYASSHLNAHKHHRSPGINPGNPNAMLGEDKSLPLDLVKSKNSFVITAATRCKPWSLWSVLQKPSLRYPVKGDFEQSFKVVPSTFFNRLSFVLWKILFKHL